MSSPHWSPLVHRLTPYVPGELPAGPLFVKLNTNEHPDPPSPRAEAALRQAISRRAAALRLYPAPQSRGLCQALARHHAAQADQVFVGNGSDEVLALAFMALLRHPRRGGAALLAAPHPGATFCATRTRRRPSAHHHWQCGAARSAAERAGRHSWR